MVDPLHHDRPERKKETEEALSESVLRRAERKLRYRKESGRSVWFGLGMFGLVGWSVAIPTLAGTALGVWLDGLWPSNPSWTLTFLFVGVVVGCLTAWYWIQQERSS